jgi:hypothetical protein
MGSQRPDAPCLDISSSRGIRICTVSDPASSHRSAAHTVVRMISPFQNSHLIKVERAEALDTSDVDAILVWGGAPRVKGIYPTHRAEIVFGLSGIELVKRQFVLALIHVNIGQVDRNRNGAPHAAVRAVAPAGAAQSVGQNQSKPHSAAMATGAQLVATVKVRRGQTRLHSSALEPTNRLCLRLAHGAILGTLF